MRAKKNKTLSLDNCVENVKFKYLFYNLYSTVDGLSNDITQPSLR